MPRKKKEIVATIQPVVTPTQVQSALDAELEIIRQAEQTVVGQWQVMAVAVKQIHTLRLWELNYESFEHCMSDALGWKKSWAYEMLKAADVLEDAPITDASMARYLHPLDGVKRLTAWNAAIDAAQPEKPTRDDVKKAASMLRGDLGGATGGEDEKSGEPDSEVVAEVATLVPNASEFDKIMAMIREVRDSIESLAETPAGSYIGGAQIAVDLKNVMNSLAWAKPHCTCVYCEGDGCKHCQSRGWLCKGLFASAPQEMKQ